MLFIIFFSLLAGIALAALYIFLVSKFTSSYDREISLLFFPVPFLLGMWVFHSFAYNQKIVGTLAVICTIVFFKFIMGTLGVTFSKVYERLTLPKVYKNYHYTSDYKIHNLEGEKHLIRLPDDIHHIAKGIYLNPQNELVIYDKSIPMDRDQLSVINYIEKYNALGERIPESDTLEVQQDMPSIFDGNSERFLKKETLERKNIKPLYVQSYKTKGDKYETILYFEAKTQPYTFRFKNKFLYIKNQKELSKTPTTYYENDSEIIESFGNISLYTNKHLYYQLLQIKDDIYMVK
ncbi:hypothetical protein [Capnocytophaga gingivalis]|uniref:hypothetical protein n=1 Tax=Capnocytophaga gingivalis TaxID=1017 RepID=UPI002B47FCD4|nr:hypothetical protein [Capnocytophaga gingivalis]MEB3014641.1 hypothetical protein [Capnocytophaga gingivalis]